MTHRRDNNVMPTSLTPDAVRELLGLVTNAENPFSDLLILVLNAAMKLERKRHLRNDHHERRDDWYGCANGLKHCTFKTRLGTIEVSVPQVRGSDARFRPASFDAAMASKKAFTLRSPR